MHRRSFLGGSISSLTSSQQQPSDLTDLTLAAASDLVHRRKVSPVELTEACLSKIDRLDPTLKAYVRVLRDDALNTAKLREQQGCEMSPG